MIDERTPNSNTEVTLSVHTGKYWRADALVASTGQDFEQACAAHDAHGMRSAFFHVTYFYGKTLNIWRQALLHSNESLANATLENLILLDAALGSMHTAAPHIVPLAMPLTKEFRNHFTRGLIVRVLDETPLPLRLEQIVDRLDEFELLGHLRPENVQLQLDSLVADDIVALTKSGYRRTSGQYSELSSDAAILELLLDEKTAAGIAADGFHGIIDVAERRRKFVRVFCKITGLSKKSGKLFVSVAMAFSGEQVAGHTRWRHLDLLHSHTPRPYQRTAFAVLQGSGYQASLLEATTGCGKTLIGLMCIQDWLRRMESGHSVLILVPTNNYQQQWVRELCFHRGVLQLAPEVVFSGTIADLRRLQKRAGHNPAVFVLTYSALTGAARSMSPALGQLDSVASCETDAVQSFVEAFGVQYVVLDEAHKVVDDLHSVTAGIVRQLTRKLHEGHLSGLIGFSGTLSVPHRHFKDVGLHVVHRVPLEELVGTGFVAPFAEFGVPYALSDREQTVAALLEDYRDIFRKYLGLCDLAVVCAEFENLASDQRMLMISRLLGMYHGRVDKAELLRRKTDEWLRLESLSLSNSGVVLIVQAATGLSEFSLVPRRHWPDLKLLLERATELRNSLASLCSLDDVADVLTDEMKLGEKMHSSDVLNLLRPSVSEDTVRRRFRQLSRSTLAGVYFGLRQWSRHLGEGRVAAVKAILSAEHQSRRLTGAIIFDNSRAIHWGAGEVSAGFEGVGGMFAHLLGEDGVVPIAALSKEIYLPAENDNAFAISIAGFVCQKILLEEYAAAINDLLLSGLELPAETSSRFRNRLAALLATWLQQFALTNANHSADEVCHRVDVQSRSNVEPKWAGFVDAVIRPLRSTFGHMQSGVCRRSAAKLRTRLHRRNVNLKSLMKGFFDYIRIADDCLQSFCCELKQADGTHHRFRVIPIPNGRRRQLMYDLIARLIDDKDLPFNVVIVSDWARSGWNVITPNLLIDATATRDVTAWQQLRGRAMRSLRSWNINCYRTLTALRANHDYQQRDDEISEGEVSTELKLNEEQTVLLSSCMDSNDFQHGLTDGVSSLPAETRFEAAVNLLQNNNKVTHIYELLDIAGRDPQLVYDRSTSTWQRRESIARKHHGQLGVDLATNSLVTEAVDSMLVCDNDPQHQTVAELAAAVSCRITDCDRSIIKAWLKPGFNIDS